MPEGPTIVILKEEVQQFTGKQITAVEGNAKIDLDRLLHRKVIFLRSWGKHFLIGFDNFTVRIHLLMFGSYLVNETKSAKVRLGLTFKNGTLNFYASNVKILEGDINDHYSWKADVMSDQWDPKVAKKKLKNLNDALICDVLLDQEIFAGVGNIIKNEALYRARIHPHSIVGALPAKKISEILKECRNYSFDFLEWKKNFSLKKHWLAYSKKICKRCDLPIIKDYAGALKRRNFYCDNCQKLYK